MGFNVIETIAVATSVCVASVVSRPSELPRLATMKENSPICDRTTATGSPTRSGLPRSVVIASAARGFPNSTTASVRAMRPGARNRYCGSSSMPIETKNRTAKASRIGKASDAARTLNSDRPTTIPPRNAPSAIDAPKSFAAATAIPSASASTVKVKSSRDRVFAT